MRLHVELRSGLMAEWQVSKESFERYEALVARGLRGQALLEKWLRMSSSDPVKAARIIGATASGADVNIDVDCEGS